MLVLALMGVLALYRNAVGNLTERTASTVTRQAGRGYGAMDAPLRTASAAPHEDPPAPPQDPPPDSAGTAAVAAASRPSGIPFRLAKP